MSASIPRSTDEANSHNAPKTPPSDTAWTATASLANAISVIFATSRYSPVSMQLLTNVGENFFSSSSFLEIDIIYVAPIPAVPAITTCIFSFMFFLACLSLLYPIIVIFAIIFSTFDTYTLHCFISSCLFSELSFIFFMTFPSCFSSKSAGMLISTFKYFGFAFCSHNALIAFPI